MTRPSLLAFSDAVSAAALDDRRWTGALELLADATGSTSGQLIGIGGPRSIPFNIVSHFPDKALREFVEIEGGRPDVNQRVQASIGTAVMEIVSERDYARAVPRLSTDVYLDFCRDYDIMNGCQTKLFEDRDGLIGLALLRTQRDGETNARQRRTFAMAAPLVRGAVRIHRLLELDRERLAAGMFDAMALAAFVCDSRAAVLHATAATEGLLRLGRLATPARRLSTVHRGSTEALHAAIQRACAADVAGLTTIVCTGAPGEPPLLLDVVALPPQNHIFSLETRALVVVRERPRDEAATARLLRAAYRLSPTEAAIAMEIAIGRDRGEIAARRGVSVETVRTQLRSAFQKMDVRRESELAERVGRFR